MPGPRRRMRRRAVVGGAMIASHHAANEQQQYEEQQYAATEPEAAPVPAEPAMDQKIHEIEELARLRDSGALTEEEFAQQKQVILDS